MQYKSQPGQVVKYIVKFYQDNSDNILDNKDKLDKMLKKGMKKLNNMLNNKDNLIIRSMDKLINKYGQIRQYLLVFHKK